MKPLEERMRNWKGAEMDILVLPDLPEGTKEIVLITHDESTFYSNEGAITFWMENGKKNYFRRAEAHQ